MLPGATFWFTGSGTAAADDSDVAAQAASYKAEITPLLKRYCHECHSGERTEADVDLATFATFEDVRKHPKVWQKVNEMLGSGQMPPKGARQPGEPERTRLKQWVHGYLKFEAQARAGDPGRVVLRRLSNAEYTYTLRDLTGIAALDPAREFPIDGAAGEGFTNTGNALVMSPALITKYLDAAKEVADHAVLLPDGIRFSPSTTRSDWTNEALARIRDFYQEFVDQAGGDKVNLQGIVFETNTGGRLPLEKYLAATLVERGALQSGAKTIAAVAREHQLNAKYLGTLWSALTDQSPSLLLDRIRARWRDSKPEHVPALVAQIAAWQKALWKFSMVGQIGKIGGPKSWLEPVSPLVAQQDLRFKLPAAGDNPTVSLFLVTGDAADGHEHDVVIWQKPRLVAPGRPDILLRDLRQISQELIQRRERVFASASRYLDAAATAAASPERIDVAQLATQHAVDPGSLRAWLDYLGIGTSGPIKIEGYFTKQLKNSTYDFIRGWGSDETPLVLANSSDQHVRVPGNMKPHGVAVHPSPTLRAVVGWRSPVTAAVTIEAVIKHAHPECGNGVTWSLELRRGATRRRLATGTAQGAAEAKAVVSEALPIQAGDLVSLLIGPRDGNHSCDLTAVDLKVTTAGSGKQTWNLADDVSSDVQAANPHADRLGNDAVWHFYTEPDQGAGEFGPVIPPGSLVAKWLASADPAEKQALAAAVQQLLTAGPPEARENPDAILYRQLASLGGPLFKAVPVNRDAAPPSETQPRENWGLDPGLFGKDPRGASIDADSLAVAAPAVLEVRLPADLVAGRELVATGVLASASSAEGSAQLQVVANPSEALKDLQPGIPILASAGSAAHQRVEKAFAEFRDLFPAALCYTKIVPVDEVITLTLFYREDQHLVRLMLSAEQEARLNRYWEELRFVSQDALTLVDAFVQLLEYASQDADPKVFEPMRKPINDRAAAFRKLLVDTEPVHLAAVIEFAARAYRRPLTGAENRELRNLYAQLRSEEIPHAEAIRLTLARILVAPAFLYHIESPAPGTAQTPVSDWELASRLSYFLWSAPPDGELKQLAAAGRLHETDVLVGQMRRMLRSSATRRLAIEFGCQWLHIHEFAHLDEKSERHFPTFLALRESMYEESVRFLTDLFQNDGSVLAILNADHTFLNEDLARHYGIPDVSGPGWRRVDGVKRWGRGGILGLATTLATQSGASRTSPILRGNWVSEVLLGERLPRPPKDVPRLPEDEAATEGLTVRQLVEKHSSDPRCAVCHKRIDAFGFSLEGYDAIGRRRERDLADRPIETHAKTQDGSEFDGLDGLRNHLLTVRREAFVRQFCRKLLGYALGREIQLSDESLLLEMDRNLKETDYKLTAALETIVKSRQFREIRGRERADEE